MILTWVCLVISTHLDAARLASVMSFVVAKRVHLTPSVDPSILFISFHFLFRLGWLGGISVKGASA